MDDINSARTIKRGIDHVRTSASLAKTGLYVRLAALTAVVCLAVSACGDSGGKPGSEVGVNAPGGPLATNPPEAGPSAGPAAVAAPVVAKIDTSKWKVQPPFYAVGEEPAWQLELNDNYFTFKRGSGIPEIDTPFVAPVAGNNADVFNTETFKITVEPGSCEVGKQTGVADITIQMGGISYDGCVFKGTSDAGAAGGDDEASDLIADLPGALGAVDACLAKLGDAAVISAIYPRGDEAMGVAMRGRGGALFECEAHSAAGPAESVDQIEASAAGPWLKSSVRFLRAGVGDTSKCPTAKPVVVGGKTLGVLLPKACKF